MDQKEYASFIKQVKGVISEAEKSSSSQGRALGHLLSANILEACVAGMEAIEKDGGKPSDYMEAIISILLAELMSLVPSKADPLKKAVILMGLRQKLLYEFDQMAKQCVAMEVQR